MLERGQIVDRYLVERQLGEGGMARVYLVRHTELGSRHALKVLTLRSPDLDARFMQEGWLQARLRHGNIVAVTDVLQLPQGPALVLDWVAGPSLFDLPRGRELDLDDALALFRGLAHGVGYAHAQGMIHRDLKPENVLCELRSGGLVPRIADFGLARLQDTSLGGARRTRTGMSMGTPPYMSPEQMVDASTCDERADLYSLGVLLYELIGGRLPFEGSNTVAILMARQAGHPPLTELRPEVPQRVADLVEALLEERPADRPRDCCEVLSVLNRETVTVTRLAETAPPITGALADLAQTRWSDPGPPEPLPVPSAPRPKSSDAVPLTELDPAPEPPSRRSPWPLLALGLLGLGTLGGGVLLAFLALPLVWYAEREPLSAAITTEDAAPAPAEPPQPVEDPPDEPPPPDEPEDEPVVEARAQPAPPPPAPRVAPAAPEPPAAPPVRGFQLVGDAASAWLRREGREYRDQDLIPPGTYEILAVFDGEAPIAAGRITVVEGEQPTIRCTSGFRTCARQR